MRRLVAALTVSALLTGGAPTALAQLPQLPPGVSVQDIVGAPISVPAGETTTVDLGVPVSVNYVADGWTVVSSGTSVSVTAPPEGGATAAVPVSAAGHSATLTLVSEGSAAPVEQPAPAEETAPEEQAPSQPAPAAGTTPERQTAAPVDRAAAERIDVEARIEGNQLIGTMGLRQALSLFNQFRNVSRDGLKLRYLDINGQIIQDVEREVDEINRTLTLTYPEGQTPDNPFIIEVVRDDSEAVAVVTLHDPNVAAAEPSSPEAREQEVRAQEDDETTIGLVAVGAVGLAVLLALGWLLLSRRRR
ncbi:hypothetical protein [Corynebacterium sp.]|uniref:hypothetical protein n=1 Tax=Corynebacterium sp. TaxID=1720 RepID=UPI0026DFF15F|nr:hypothetical protein [Corynebacterium sp.]MDO5511573.1 hypothetical protein [Corynebacterium sp.]